MNLKYKEKDTAVELIRIIGCFIVVGTHNLLSVKVEDSFDMSRIFLSCLYTDGVAIFWMIMGFFLFENKDYGRLLKKTAAHILLPIIILEVAVFYLGDWVFAGQTLTSSIIHTQDEYMTTILSLLTWKNPSRYLGHLWYLFLYAWIVLAYPILRAFVQYLDEDKKRIRVFLAIAFGIAVWNDSFSNNVAGFASYSLGGLVAASGQVIIGHIIYKRRHYFDRLGYAFGAVAGFVALNMFRAFIQYNRYLINVSDKAMLYWYTSIGMLCTAGVIIFAFSIQNYMQQRNIRIKCVNKVIGLLGGCTFNIYLVHQFVKYYLQRYEIPLNIQKALQVDINRGFKAEFVYMLLIVFIMMGISFIIAIIMKGIKNLWRKV